jgi:hypothetical protein
MAAPRLTITDRNAPRRLIDPEIRRRAEAVRSDAASFTPVRTGTMARGWRVVKAAQRDGLWRVTNYVRYAVYVEYGTATMHAQAPLGRAVARAQRRG